MVALLGLLSMFVVSIGRANAQAESIRLVTDIPIGKEIRLELSAQGKLKFDGLTPLREEEQSGVKFTILRVDKSEPIIYGAIKGLDCSGQ